MTDAPTPGRPGRKRDHSRDPEILRCTIDVLAETGFEGMTIEMVAARAKAGKATLYRRWASKGELVVDAVACLKQGAVDLDDLPDTGTLRGDLVAMIKPQSIDEAEKKMRVMAGVVTMLSTTPELADAVDSAIVQPRAQANRLLMRRALERGEIDPATDIESLALVTPSMVSYRVLVLRRPVDRDFLISLIDGVLLPAAGVRQPADA
ncbi:MULTISPECIES: TetR/AcrR family transcriptional regulator [Frigoribacterium]|uniref:TetR/AcrR family transcriptional regulator n=1 Tax=Frigoribacterium TaxID=96492 RepID=UPI00177E0D9F|nr:MULTISPECIES: TetR/AcrR family transcriptional regulator [Frigoribacterium]MBD8703666.1 TetR/AcrR family transcriptional regulator [Frigoribacterium sp. CFBP 13712]MCJ0701947.1 TetR/AcrR family transcriptional regulator [Frigoribacterium faeni]MDY0890823.1 TetR/AcrR family transcriptional regulator [Frigoribacterium sp. CFBP9030]